MAGFLDSIKSFFSGNIEVKASELLDKIVAMVKPYIEKGEVSEGLSNAVSGFDGLSDKLMDVLGKLKTSSGDTLTKLTADKNDIVASIVEKGTALLDNIEANPKLPAAVKELAEQAEALLKKLK